MARASIASSEALALLSQTFAYLIPRKRLDEGAFSVCAMVRVLNRIRTTGCAGEQILTRPSEPLLKPLVLSRASKSLVHRPGPRPDEMSSETACRWIDGVL